MTKLLSGHVPIFFYPPSPTYRVIFFPVPSFLYPLPPSCIWRHPEIKYWQTSEPILPKPLGLSISQIMWPWQWKKKSINDLMICQVWNPCYSLFCFTLKLISLTFWLHFWYSMSSPSFKCIQNDTFVFIINY